MTSIIRPFAGQDYEMTKTLLLIAAIVLVQPGEQNGLARSITKAAFFSMNLGAVLEAL